MLVTRGRARLLLGPIALAIGLVGTPTSARGQDYDLSGRAVAIYNIAGEVRVVATSGSQVTVAVDRGGSDGAKLSVETGKLGTTQTLRVIYPGDRIVYPPLGRRSRTQLRARDDGTFGGNSHNGRGRGERVTVVGSGSGLEAYADLTIGVPEGQRIAVYLAVGAVSVTNVDGAIRIDTHSADVTAGGTSGSLVVDVGSGRVEVTNARGEVNLDTGSGGIEVTGVQGRSLLIDTGSGSVTASDIAVSDLDIDTGSGRIRAEQINASDIRLDTGSGSVTLELLSDARDIEIDTGSGSVTVTVPDSFGAEIDIDTSSGDIDLAMPVTTRRWSRDHLTGTIGDGGARLSIDTGSGTVRILSGN
ncbi:MAG: DUF4097 domain-containing protein [Gemmatimonadales bacterium]